MGAGSDADPLGRAIDITWWDHNLKAICLAIVFVFYACSTFAQDWVKKFSPKDHSNAAIYAMLDSIKNAVEESIDSVVPNLCYQDVFSGKQDSLISHRGKVVMINVWDLFCAPCVREMPILRRVQSELKEKGFVLLALSQSDAMKQRKFLADRKIILGGITAMTEFKNCPYPFTLYFNPSAYLIDRKGILRQFWIGPKTYRDLRNTIVPYL